MTRSIAEGQEIVRLVRRHGRIFQTGTQQRSWPQFRHACALARNGYLGTVHTIEVGVPGGTAYPTVATCPPPAGFDYEMWTGPAPMVPYDPQRCEWLAMYMISHYCAGFISNWGVHHLDISGWGCPEVLTSRFKVAGSGSLPTSGMTDTWIKWQMTFRWPSGLALHFSNDGNPHPMGCRFVGDKGWVRVDRSGIWAEPSALLTEGFKPDDDRLFGAPRHADPVTSHVADFFRSVRTRQDPGAPIEIGHASSTLGNVCDIALRLMNRPPRKTAGRIRSALRVFFSLVLMVPGIFMAQISAAPSDGNAAWSALPAYRHGDDLAALLAIEGEVIASMATPTARAACAARLAAVLEHPGATPAAQQWVCLMLRQVGTPAEVPCLARELSGRDMATVDAARQATESIPGAASASALRDFLPRAEGTTALGVINSIGRRGDAAAVPMLEPLAAGDDPLLAKAAANALGLIGTPPAIGRLRSLGETLGAPTPPWLREPLLRAAQSASQAGDQESWRSINELLSRDRQPPALRQAALKQMLDTMEGRRSAVVGEWLDSTDRDRRQVAAGAVGSLDETTLARALATLDSHPPQAQLAILTVASAHIRRLALPVLDRLVSAGSGDVRVTAIECLGRIGSAECLPPLLTVFAEKAPEEGLSSALNAARNALISMPSEIVGPRLVGMLEADSRPREDLVSLIGEIREPTAWNALAADGPAGDREYVLERTAAAVCSMDGVEWIAGHLDDSSVAQAACRAIVALAHHRTLRQPNSKRLGELLDRVADVTTDPLMAVRANRYKLGR